MIQELMEPRINGPADSRRVAIRQMVWSCTQFPLSDLSVVR